MNTTQNITLNRLPAPTWNHLGMNESSIPAFAVQGAAAVAATVPQGLCTLAAGDALWVLLRGIAGGMGEINDGIATPGASAVLGYQTGADCKIAEPLRLDFTLAGGENTLNEVGIYAADGSEVTVIMMLHSAAAATGTAVLRTRLYAGKNAKIQLVQVQLLGEGTRFLNDIGSDCDAGGQVEITQLVLGGGDTYNGCRAALNTAQAGLTVNIAYRLTNAARLDMNYIADHAAPRTNSRINAVGVLSGGAFKLFRGTIDFKRGSAGSKGNEKEDVLLLSDDVVNQTIPLILCKEEDVEGNHGATIGQLDEDLLFYLAARGFSQPQIYDLMARARIDAVCKKIPDEATRQAVQAYLDGGAASGEVENYAH